MTNLIESASVGSDVVLDISRAPQHRYIVADQMVIGLSMNREIELSFLTMQSKMTGLVLEKQGQEGNQATLTTKGLQNTVNVCEETVVRLTPQRAYEAATLLLQHLATHELMPNLGAASVTAGGE